MTWLALFKVLHIAGLMTWCGGLIVMPSLYRQRSHLATEDELNTWHRFTRDVFVGIVSPAGFVAIGSGTALLFLNDVFTTWMFLKLAAVGVLVMLHLHAAYVILHLHKDGKTYSSFRQAGATAVTLLAAGATLMLVLAKPDLALDLPGWLTQPGALQSSLSGLMRPMP